ncbi:plasmid partitioning protein RepA [Rhizobium leguminosarum]|uniref:plasmid partitioning protein RepA n=1 Tax=Rhizobium leguminosarum TaxID=384 RepID=UPI0036D9E8EC
MPHCKNPLFQLDTTSERIRRHGKELWDRLRARGAAPEKILDDRPLRPFSLGEVAEILGVSGSYLRQLSIDGLGPTPELGTAGRRSYTLRQINELRAYLASTHPKEALKFCPRRREGEKLQIISVAGGPSTTTTSLYLTQGLALQGFRVLAVDLDPKGSLSEMYGYFTATLPVDNASMYAAIRYDDHRVSMRSIIQKTHFDGLHFVPGSSELGEFEEECSRRYHSENFRYPDASIRMVSALKEVDADYDVVVIHCAPECGGFLTVGAFEAATGVLVMARPQLADIAKTAMFLNFFSHFVSLIEKAGRSVNYDFVKFLVTRHNPRDVSEQEAVTLLRDSLGDDLLTATVWESDAIREAGLKNRSLYELSAGAVGRSAYEQAMETLNSTNAEVMDIISEVWGRPPMYVSQASRSKTEGKANSQSRGLSK